MQYYRLYSSIAAIALGIHLIVNWQQLTARKNLESRPGARECSAFLLCQALFFVSDILWGIFAGLGLPHLLFADTTVFFLLPALSVFAWTRYVIVYLEMNGGLRECMRWAGNSLLALIIAGLTVNCFTGIFFAVDAYGDYSSGPLRHLVYTLLFVFNVFSSVLTLAELLRARGEIRRRNTMVFVVGVTMTAAIMLQFGDPFLPMYSLGSLFGSCLLHVFVFEDERDEMRRKEMLAQAQLETERAAAQAKSLFFSTVSHDIRTPLNAVVGFSELLQQGVEDEAERARCIASICSSGKVLARLVDDILDLSKLESGKLEIIEEPTDIPALVRDVVVACEVIRKHKSLTLKTEIDEMPLVSVDPQRIRQLLFNLLSNAYKYTDRGTVTLRVRRHDGTLTLSVADTGKGIAPEDIRRIFQPFVQLADKNHRSGTGLGLPICQKLARLMGGELTVESTVGAGSTFTVTLPDIPTAEPPVRQERTAHPAAPAHSAHRILIADDSSVNRAVLKAMLARIGVGTVETAQDGREALALLKRGPEFDLLLSDLWMPEMDGRAPEFSSSRSRWKNSARFLRKTDCGRWREPLWIFTEMS